MSITMNEPKVTGIHKLQSEPTKRTFYSIRLAVGTTTLSIFVDDIKGFLNNLELAYTAMQSIEDRKILAREEIKENE